MLIGIDAGHGRYTSGKRCSKQYDSNETREWVLNSRVANYVQQYLSEYKNVSTIRLDDTTGNTDIPLSTRCRTANRQKCDLVVSIHHNAGGGNGLETYVWSGSKLPQQTVNIATTIHNACINATGQKNRGLKRADFAMVRDTYMDACLIEGGFMDHPEDTPRILTDDFARKYARGIVNGIVQYYKLKGGNTPTPSPTPTPVTPTKPTCTGDIHYRTYDGVKKQYLPTVVNDSDYAGNKGHPIQGFKGYCENGNLYMRTHTLGKPKTQWEETVVLNKSNFNSSSPNAYAGIIGKDTDCVQVWSDYGYILYRSSPVGKDYYPWVDSRNRNNGKSNAYAGSYGVPMDRFQMK